MKTIRLNHDEATAKSDRVITKIVSVRRVAAASLQIGLGLRSRQNKMEWAACPRQSPPGMSADAPSPARSKAHARMVYSNRDTALACHGTVV